ncbi:F-type H+-transporting ATPase subunit b [Cruoricaptor ignavus]|uniref:ATP synthase subunit b n=1 Tax=Cruoricaptor ignavus TaxID=1118202 RepID=A0A1M6EJF2_9FLAO|nr:F0F1 ATP synthase subunit B [Cruoricaptor ignavus]QOR74256.1 F0F1 ATP synthase subunit B [Cruoricaptor ignavus]SHI85635.1 F-type H+-transporting ATPase subunit b [Cruoricaptor ignavus]
MDLLTPSIGNIFWTSVVFLMLLFILGKYAWRPILSAVGQREKDIQDALNQAQLARKEIEDLKADNERILREAKLERDAILNDARKIRENMIAEARDTAKQEGDKMIESARISIQNEKAAAMKEVKSQIGALSVSIAEQILKQKLDASEAQNALVENYLAQNNLN